MIQKIDKQHVQEAVQEAYERFKGVNEGKNADYIPYLANVPANLFGIAACLPDGEVIAVGDTDYKFGIESVSKVPTAILAMNQYSAEEVLEKIGADATGLPFNSIMAILLEKDHPSTPLVNAGAISACSMIQPFKYKRVDSCIYKFHCFFIKTFMCIFTKYVSRFNCQRTVKIYIKWSVNKLLFFNFAYKI